MPGTFPLLRLPLELREYIYSLYFNPTDHLTEGEYGGGHYAFDLQLFRVNKQICTEAQDVFRRENVFVRIETPWPQAGTPLMMDPVRGGLVGLSRRSARSQHHIAQEGLVPLVAAGVKGDLFKHHHALVQISAPLHEFVPTHSIVVLLDDLHLFCQVWYYSALNYRTLNDHLSVTFVLRDPYYPADPKPIPHSLQRRLLLPFEKVKGLYLVEVEGYATDIEAELRVRMAIPYDSVQKCLEDSTALMETGDKVLSEGKPSEALSMYTKAFHAMHIIISGRTRRVLADAWFHEAIESGRYAGQTGPTVRITLRIRLVARTVLTYLKLGQWEEAAFWGMRSIRIMREAVDTEFEDFLAEVVGVSEVGFIYFRTAVAFMKMEECGCKELSGYKEQDAAPGQNEGLASSRRLFELAGRYLKRGNEAVARKEARELGVGVPEGTFVVEGVRSDVDSLEYMNREEAERGEGEQSVG